MMRKMPKLIRNGDREIDAGEEGEGVFSEIYGKKEKKSAGFFGLVLALHTSPPHDGIFFLPRRKCPAERDR